MRDFEQSLDRFDKLAPNDVMEVWNNQLAREGKFKYTAFVRVRFVLRESHQSFARAADQQFAEFYIGGENPRSQPRGKRWSNDLNPPKCLYFSSLFLPSPYSAYRPGGWLDPFFSLTPRAREQGVVILPGLKSNGVCMRPASEKRGKLTSDTQRAVTRSFSLFAAV